MSLLALERPKGLRIRRFTDVARESIRLTFDDIRQCEYRSRNRLKMPFAIPPLRIPLFCGALPVLFACALVSCSGLNLGQAPLNGRALACAEAPRLD